MQHTLYLAALVQICLSGSILAALLLWLFVTHTLGTRRQAAARQLDRDLADCFSNALPQALPQAAYASRDGRAALMTALLQDGDRGRQRMHTLELEAALTADLAVKRDRLRTMVRMGEARLPGVPDALAPYWTSSDPDEQYFSLYYSARCALGADQRARVRTAVENAALPPARKTEMLAQLARPDAPVPTGGL